MKPEYVREQYEIGRSLADIAREHGTYPTAVRRLLARMGVRLRTRSEAQAEALARGSHPHPTAGRPRPPEVRAKIGEGVARSWAAAGRAERSHRRESARREWTRIGSRKRARRLRLAGEALQASRRGSRLELFLLDGLRQAGYDARHRTGRGDVELADFGVVIFVNGPHHLRPVSGGEELARRRERDRADQALLALTGHLVVVVRDWTDHFSAARARTLLTFLLKMLELPLSNTIIHEVDHK